MRHVIGVKKYLLFLFLVIVANGCQSPSEMKPTPIQEKIVEDINNGLSDKHTFEINIPNIPKTSFHAEKEHSSIFFKTQHWEIVNLMGWFSDFDIVMYTDSADFSDAIIYGRVNPLSVTMPNNKMAGSVKQAPYIDAEKYGDVTFLSESFDIIEENKYALKGKMSMNGIEKSIKFIATFNGFAYPGEKSICGFDVYGQIDRNDFNVGGDDKLHSGRIIHDNIIHLYLSLRME